MLTVFISTESTSWIRTRPHSRPYPDGWRRQEQPGSGFALAIVLGLLMAAPDATAQATDSEPDVKMSRSGICHQRGTVHYRQTIYFKAFDSMETCLAAGGRRMGGEFDADRSQPVHRETRPRRDYRPFVAGGVVAAAALIAGSGFLWRRRKVSKRLRDFHDRERRRWEGHKIEPRKPPR